MTQANFTQLNLQMEQDAPTINDIKIPCLFWADDLVLISTTKDVVNDYCSDWKLTLNAEKTRTVLFNKTGATLRKHQIHYGGELIKTVKYFSYLGITLDSNGKFNTAVNELLKKAAKAAGRLYKLSTYNYISIQTLLETFNSLVKPILLFSSEIWGHEPQGGYTSISLTGMLVQEQISTTQKNRMTLNSNPQKIECPKIQTQKKRMNQDPMVVRV